MTETTTEPVYCTVAQLQAELEVDADTTDTASAVRIIEDAEDLVDRMLGGWMWGPDESTGRKVIKSDVQLWQWNKLSRATVNQSARMYRNPSILEQAYETVSGPDFSMSGPKGGALVQLIGVHVLALLDDSGLRKVAGRAEQGRYRRAYKASWERFFIATRHDGT